ncbi:MAG: PQQ-binding-like beta-propeller repeat protein [Bryobacterales bacterium]|nr:PQQ-binding-like beta-propeller repeat protein [Bryobacterales bacterium]
MAQFVFILLTVACSFAAEDWPEFRGPNRSGTSDAKHLPERFDRQTNLVWTTAVPMGRSSPIVKNGRVFLTASAGGNLMVLAFDLHTGRSLWTYSIPRARQNEIDPQRNDPASSTPVTDGERIYAFFQDFGIIALNWDGKLAWQFPMDTFVNNYGIASSPIVSGENVIFQADQVRGSYVIAINKKTGKPRWKIDRPNAEEGWATPLLRPEAGELISLSSATVDGADLETGKTRWSVPASHGLMIPSPTISGDVLVATIRGSEQPTYPAWARLVTFDADNDGKVSPDEFGKFGPRNSFGIADPDRDGFITEKEWTAFRNRGVGDFGITAISLKDRKVLWRHQKGLPYVPSPVIYQGIVYVVRTGGVVTALDLTTGQVLKEARAGDALGDYFASPIAADGKVYVCNAQGKIAVLKAGASWDVIAVNDLSENMAATPAIVESGLIVRTHKSLLSFSPHQ